MRPSRSSGIGSALTTLLVGIGACGTEGGDGSSVVPAGAPLGLGDAPLVVVGERPGDPDHELFKVVTPLLLEGGDIGVPLAGDGAIRIFDASGELVRSLGSSGEGPGEFRSLWSAWVRGDTVEAHDVDLGRITRFIPGRDPQTFLLEHVDAAQIAAPGLDDGSWILHGVGEVLPSGRDVIGVHRFGPDGRHMGEVSRTFGFRRHVFEGGSGPDPISPRAVVRTDGDRVLVAETLTPRITEVSASTGEVRAVEWTPRDPVDHDEAIRRIRGEIERSAMPEAERAWHLSSLDALTGSEAVPAFQDFLIDGDDFLWIRPYDPRIHGVPLGGLQGAGAGGEWTVIDGRGETVSTVPMPADFEPRAIHGDRLIGVRRDELDVESVRVYRIVREAGE